MIHVLFSSSAAGTLRHVLRARGLRQRVIDLTESLDWGRIARDNFEDRQAWLDRNAPLDLGARGWLVESVTTFRERIAADVDRLIWIAPRSAAEQAGLYWYLDQFGAAGAQMIVADLALRGSWRGEPPLTLGELQQDQMAELLDEYPRASWDASRFSADRWQELVAEDALLRIVTDGALRSAPEDYFDQFLLEHCSHSWRKWFRVVADAVGSMWDAGHRADAEFLTWRLRDLIERGEVACNGELPRSHGSPTDTTRVRLR